MTTDFDAIADRSKKAKMEPWRAAIASVTLLDPIGRPDGLKVPAEGPWAPGTPSAWTFPLDANAAPGYWAPLLDEAPVIFLDCRL